MTWRPTPRTPEALAIYAAAEQDRAAQPERYRLEVATVVEKASRRCDANAFADGWQAGLETLLGSAEHEARLNAVGVRMVQQMAVGRLVAGATIARYRADHPEVVATQLLPPIVIVGGWRTGTTFLFRLLGSDPRLHAPLPAELVSPWLFAGAERPADPYPTAGASQLLHTLNPDMAFVHPSGPDLPEECVLGMGTDLRNWGFTSMLRLPSYAAWLAGQNLGQSYLRYREVLQLNATHDSRRFVLKAPAHTAELRHLVAAFPGAVVVQVHRDIVETLTSGSSLFAVYRSTYSDDVDAVDVARQQIDQSELWFRRATDFRASPDARAATFVDFDYRAFIGDPAAALRVIYHAAGMEPPADLAGFVNAYRAADRAEVARHRYEPADFGIDENELRERFAFLSELAGR
ncbi:MULTISPECIES: sulfotransferase family protein [Mycobacterium]|uniref:Sulfotransferase n=1 Tax=Mycobacterium kiyosense TaxID=2871094 RepID=A0A9P3Q4Q3_9MYCO|nr:MULTISPECIES: sulfotransferase [Mycobacterium]BDB39763.1 putative sulfotransferase [Mycobacterium kiyosense]BDE11618.1 putative sulfotransferase [Mycobacterium sp. 20KCMC460]GLB81896.1 putative sulfotransferase [Mycobacterium kiyosense]GLB88144.1 putative sulfotransferase [Mycobacterium kiyosense]GLB95704.1 putative sulfotransferase [Mycobacterium kiyosense]